MKDDKIQTIVVHGDVADSILEIAKKEHCDLIVIGTNARSGVEEFFLGSTAYKLIKHSTQPIYTIPTESKLIFRQLNPHYALENQTTLICHMSVFHIKSCGSKDCKPQIYKTPL